jgi:hypothetical protein
MPGLSLKERIEWLERELPPGSSRFTVHDDLPFAILVYPPAEEWAMRRETKLLAARLQKKGRTPVFVSLAELLWEAIDDPDTGGLDALVALEKDRGFDVAQEQAHIYLSDEDFTPLPATLAERLSSYDPNKHICFLHRAASLGPDIYHLSKLLDEMQGRTRVPTILLYPGSLVDTNALRFMDLPDRDALGSYRVKIYA